MVKVFFMWFFYRCLSFHVVFLHMIGLHEVYPSFGCSSSGVCFMCSLFMCLSFHSAVLHEVCVSFGYSSRGVCFT